jgi:glycerol-3-phosphate O-acyltransferase
MKNSNFKDPFILELESTLQANLLPEKYFQVILDFYECYKKAEKNATKRELIFQTFLKLIIKQIKDPYQFQHYHEKIREPFDYYQFSIDFAKPLLEKEKSNVFGIDQLKKISCQIEQNNNVILFANHQTEIDPQLIILLLKDRFPAIAEKLIFVAGDRVVTDPLAVPFSMGCNLLCIYSKRYIETPIELKEKKQLHNHKTMYKMADLLKSGGKIIYVAPSGGRDRKDKNNNLDVALFDPQSIEMFYLIAKKAKTKTSFFPLSLFTYDILPPPKSIQVALGEKRVAKKSAAQLFFGEEIAMGKDEFSKIKDKCERRKKRAEYIWNLVQINYQKLPKSEDI